MSYLRVIQITFLIYVAVPRFANGFIKLRLNDILLKLNDSKLNFKLGDVEEKWIEQPLDHFDSNEKRTFKMKYLQRLDLWQTKGPIYIFIGWEEPTDPLLIAGDYALIGQLAKDTNGALFATEHRYYGMSNPHIPVHDVIKYYKYLSSQQALADNAKFITFLKSDPKYKSSKVVVVGGSYSGNLATWMRELYPGLVDAAVAASAPVLAKKDFYEYLDITRYTFGKYGDPNCLNDIEKTFKRYEGLLQSADGIEKLKTELNICPYSDLTVFENQQFLFLIQYAQLKAAAQNGQLTGIIDMCNRYSEKSTPDHSNSFKQIASHDSCVDVNFSALKDISSWAYQFCNEFGYLQTTNSEKQPFVHWGPLEIWLKYCRYVVEGDVEEKMDEGIAKTNKMYGGITPNVSKVVFTHGDMDPWRALGVQQDLSPDAPVTVVNGTSHCAILFALPGELEELKENRKYVKTLIKKWIGV